MISTSPLFPAVAASVCAPRDTHAHTRERHTHAFILYMMCICTHVSFSSLISLLISGARKTAAAHSRLEMRCILSHVRPTLYFACESCLRLHRRRLAKVNLRLIPVLIISLPARRRRRRCRRRRARVPHFLWRSALMIKCVPVALKRSL